MLPLDRTEKWLLFVGFAGAIALAAAVGAISSAGCSRCAAAPFAEAKAGEVPGGGGLIAVSPDGKRFSCPLQHTDVDIAVSGFMARASVTQTFANPSSQRIEAVYIFPLPENAAVDDMIMRIGKRTIRGVIKERQEARQMYEEARREGKTASLLEQERPNIFTQSVANILPGDEIKITITYTQYLKYEKGTLSLAFPMVVGPRYIPGARTHIDGSVTPVPGMTQTVPDADRITPPYAAKGERSGHDISVKVALAAGVPFADLRSKSHQVSIQRMDDSNAYVKLDEADNIPNKDFILEWDVNPARVATGLLTHRPENDTGYFTLMMVPNVTPKPAEVTPREMVFVLDCSGSMSGKPIEQAKQLVRHALGHLNPDDSFQVINFSMSASGMSPLPVPNTPENVKTALHYLDSLHGEGGTEMITGIRAALAFPPDPERLRIVMFLTDGYIGNETEILAAIRTNIGRARLFSFGAGSSVNRYLLENMALEGRGTVQYVRYDEDATKPVEKFYDQIRSPLLTDIEIDWGGLRVFDTYPARIPDLFAGHPLFVTGRYDQPGEAVVKVRGRIAGETVELPARVIFPERNAQNSVVRTLWARHVIDDLMRMMLQGEKPEVVKRVVEMSIKYRLLSQYTAFVAVEEKVRTNEKGDPVTVEVPVEMPDGVSHEGVFGKGEKEGKKIGGIMARSPAPPPAATAAPSGAFGMGFRGTGAGGGGSSAGYGHGSGAVMGKMAAPAKPSVRYSAPMMMKSVGGSGAGQAAILATPAEEPAADRRMDLDSAEKSITVTLTVTSQAGALADAAFETAARALLPVIKRCLAFGRTGGKALPASLVVKVKTDAKGKVIDAAIQNPPADLDPSVKFCIERTFKGLRLAGEGEARVTLLIKW